jgi:alkanesulfonate monooxygenase SsuD/methylene tetrahydromethanopterin reductase-like flavin-dependent oxidoreductase (luciferase family)
VFVEISNRPFRFGVITFPTEGAEQWRATARRAAELGYSTVLMPDVVRLLAPAPALAVAAEAAHIRVGTWVYAAPLRAPGITAWEAHSLAVLTEGRFEMGIGTGRRGIEPELAELGLPLGSPAERLARVSATITALRQLDGTDRRTPVLVAAGGPKARTLAAEQADIVSLAAGPGAPRAKAAAMAADLWAKASGRAEDIELVAEVIAVGNDLPPGIEQMTGIDAATLRASDSFSLLLGDDAAVIDQLQRCRDEIGASYITAPVQCMEALAPAVAALAGR